MFCTRCNLILQASVCPLVCVPEEYTIRGEVRREEVADSLAAVRRWGGREGTLKPSTGWSRDNVRMIFYTILPFLLLCSDLHSVIRYVSCFLKIFSFRWIRTSVINLYILMETNILNWLVSCSTSFNDIIMTNKYCTENLSVLHKYEIAFLFIVEIQNSWLYL